MAQQTTPCGCVVEDVPEYGIIRSVTKCAHHVAHLERMPRGRAYYEDLGCIVDLTPQCHVYKRELSDAGIEIPHSDRKNDVALEIGCGCSMYAPLVLSRGYQYKAVELDAWAANWTSKAYCCEVANCSFELFNSGVGQWGLVMAMHCLEHMSHAPDALHKMRSYLRPGGTLVVLVPDDRDLCNPDHLWFFNRDALCAMLERLGLRDVQVNRRSVVAHEDFLYAIGRAPA